MRHLCYNRNCPKKTETFFEEAMVRYAKYWFCSDACVRAFKAEALMRSGTFNGW